MEAIIGKEFPKKVIPLIEHTKTSLKIVVFDWRWYPNDPANPVQLFNQAIIRAKRRGVKIQIIGNCEDVLKIFREQGIKASKPISKNLLHAKLIIFDDKDLVIGSHNFTQNAFTMNFEVSIYIPDCPGIENYLRFFNSLWQI
ncbi:MAG: phospholipase D-like domain-containing protein [Dehalococcoidia bacterium]|nr:phospholipase D-like domain-containing protein [Dehalococcoidia bacterium]